MIIKHFKWKIKQFFSSNYHQSQQSLSLAQLTPSYIFSLSIAELPKIFQIETSPKVLTKLWWARICFPLIKWLKIDLSNYITSWLTLVRVSFLGNQFHYYCDFNWFHYLSTLVTKVWFGKAFGAAFSTLDICGENKNFFEVFKTFKR